MTAEEDDDSGSTFLADELGSFFKLLLNSTFLLDDETFTLELEFIAPLLDEDETFLFDELDLGVTLEGKDRATLDDDSSEGRVAEPQSLPQAAIANDKEKKAKQIKECFI